MEETKGKEKIQLLNKLSENNLINDPGKSLNFSKKAIQLASRTNDTSLLARSYLNIGYALRYQEEYNKALDSLYQAITMIENIPSSLQSQLLNLIGMLHQDLGHDTMRARTFIENIEENSDRGYLEKNIKILKKIADYYDRTQNYPKALSYAVKLAVFQNVAKDSTGLIHTFNRISKYWFNMENYNEAHRYARLAQQRVQNNTVKDSLKSAIYHTLGNIYEKQKQYDQAVTAYKISLENAISAKTQMLRLDNAYHLGEVFSLTDQNDQAIHYYNNAYIISEEHNIDKYKAVIKLGLARTYVKINNYDQALHEIHSALNQTGKKEFETLTPIYNTLSLIHEKKGNLTKSLKYHKTYSTYLDSLNKKNNQEAIEKIKSQYEINKKEHRINLLKTDSRIKALELSRKKARITLLIVGLSALVIVFILIVILYNNRVKTNRMLKLQNHQIKEQNEELNIINERLLETEKRLKRSNATKDKFFSIIAHDVKNPLNSFRSIIYALKNSKTQNPENLFEYMDQLDYYSSTTIELLNNLLIWARSQEEYIKPSYEQIDITQVLSNALDNQWNNLTNKNIQLNKKETDPVLINSDKNMVEFIVRNLLSNSIKFTPENGEINIQYQTNNGDVHFIISDNGIGMEEEIIEKIEQKEYISKPGTRKEKGAGLGLSMCHHFLDKIKGEMNIDSKPGEGTKIEVVFKNARM
jgi:signal transduction histidine kinase